MPGQDKTGPAGAGSMTGRRQGTCANQGNAAPAGRGLGRGTGGGRQGQGRGLGRGPGAGRGQQR